MSHQNPTGEIVPVLKRALALVSDLEKRKFGATDRPGPARGATSARHIPAAVKRAVWERDGGRCTYVSDGGQRCPARSMLELDHEIPVARGGGATAENLHVKCRAHNLHAAECALGVDFMSHKRRQARERAG